MTVERAAMTVRACALICSWVNPDRLSGLHRVLLAQRGQGVRTFFAVNDKRSRAISASEREPQLALLSLPVPLDLISAAFDLLPPQAWRDYIYFGRKRATVPDYVQWCETCDWCRVLPECMSSPCSQADLIDMAVTLPDGCKKRLMTVTINSRLHSSPL